MAIDISHAAMHALPAHVAVVDSSGRIIWVNQAWQEFAEHNTMADPFHGLGSNDLLVCDSTSGSAPEDAAAAAEGIRALLAGECAEFALDYPCYAPFEEHWFRLVARPLGERPSDGAVVMHINITETKLAGRKVLEDHLRDLALHDNLTGLPNRVLLNDRFEQALLNSSRSNGRLAVLFLDLDGFKAVNDTLGYQAGDELLVEVSRRLRPTLRAGDTAARFGGDEFVILLLGTRSPDEAIRAANRIVQTFDAPFVLSQGAVAIRASIGIAVEWSHLHTTEALLEAAEHALLQARREGQGRVVLFDGDADP